jgi:hypothetical protein
MRCYNTKFAYLFCMSGSGKLGLSNSGKKTQAELRALENTVVTRTLEPAWDEEEAAVNWRKMHISNFKLLTLAKYY